MKKCTKCGIDRPKTEYFKRSDSKDGLNAWCKPCKKVYDQSYSAENKDKLLERHRAYKAADPDRWKAYGQEYYQANKDKMKSQSRVARLKLNYGIDESVVAEMMASQNNNCAICLKDITDRAKVDHNHKTGEVRGLLCSPCNTSLGGFKDSPYILKNAYQYLVEKGHYGQEAA